MALVWWSKPHFDRSPREKEEWLTTLLLLELLLEEIEEDSDVEEDVVIVDVAIVDVVADVDAVRRERKSGPLSLSLDV